ncbi:FtsX-like permease family protein [Clostridium amylolyticum]|uniref:FtsX-like permease family protein n=1 Tax=Clostridium amylolyticum TaxID=1121298 RepID=A0A1M6FF23_9CLOT|nr:ABC transporter permease [Clostridium amylolyticum]SHI96249.1 FtsX-like permease family protein [Clostridium amylolyticum]
MRRFFKVNSTEIFLVIGFVISAFSFSIIISSTYRYYSEIVEQNKFYKDYKIASINVKDKSMELSEAITLFKKEGMDNNLTPKIATTIEIGDKFISNRIMGILGGFNIERYGEIEGRNFTTEEANGKGKLAIIGSGLKKYTNLQNGKHYIKVFNEYYEVIGVLNNSEFFKYESIIPINSFYFINNKYDTFNQLVAVDEINNLEKLSNDELKTRISEIPQESVLNYVFKKVPQLKENFYGLALGAVNLVLFSFFFAYGIKRKIAIMKVLGAKNRHVFGNILGKVLVISTLGIIIGLVLSKFTIVLMNKGFPNSYGDLDIYNILITCSLVYLISVIVSLIILFRVINFKILKEIR